MMRSLLAATLIASCAFAGTLHAQVMPFDMSGERPDEPAKQLPPATSPAPARPQPVTPAAPQTPQTPQAPPAAAQPPLTPPQPAAPATGPATPAQQPPDSTPAGQPAAQPASPASAATARQRHFVVPSDRLSLAGEFASREWTIYLTPDQAEAAARLNFGYRNSIFVAPEASTLSVQVNDTPIGETTIRSAGGVTENSIELPYGLMRPGSNKISFSASQRHRTDCTVQSTYELWTDIVPEQTYLDFDTAKMTMPPTLDDIRAVGVNGHGQTRFNIVVPKLDQSASTTPLLRLSQALGMLAAMPNQVFEFSTTLPTQVSPGELTVVVGTAAELEGVLPRLPDGALSGGIAAFVENPATASRLLVLTGPSWPAVESIVENILAPVDRPENVSRSVLMTQRWTGMNTPLLTGSTRMPFSALGLKSTEFNGRRFRTGFNVGIPSDFFGNAYGEARILLDAAYSSDVLPGSHIDIYVNGNIASTVPITSSGGSVLRHLPIRFTMRHFRPGPNLIELEAVLLTRADQVCSPGSTASKEPRFALFDTSEFRLGDFARIAQIPNLAAVAGTGFPYGRGESVDLFIDRIDNQTLSATATLLSQLAVVAGRPLRTIPKASAIATGEGDAIFVGQISQIPPLALAQTHLSEEAPKVWGTSAQSVPGNLNQDMLDEWRQKTSVISPFATISDWLGRNFDISLGSLRFAPGDEQMFLPPETANVVLSQGAAPSGNGTWLVLTAPTSEKLQGGASSLTQQTIWEQLDGSLTQYGVGDPALETRAATQVSFLPTQPFSIRNFRLIAANWLSTNILSFAVLLVCFSVLLGLATSALLSRFGKNR